MSELLTTRASTKRIRRWPLGTGELEPARLAESSQDLPVDRLEPSIAPDRWSADQRAVAIRLAALFVPLAIAYAAWPSDLVIGVASGIALAAIIAIAAKS